MSWTDTMDFTTLSPVSSAYLLQIGNSEAGMPSLSQWNGETPEVKTQVLRHGVGHVVNAVAEWIRVACWHNPNAQRGGLWSVIRMVDWAVRVSRLPGSVISSNTPEILVSWLHTALRCAVWICRVTHIAIRQIRFPRTSTIYPLTKELQQAWLCLAGHFGVREPSTDGIFYNPKWSNEHKLPRFATDDLKRTKTDIPVDSINKWTPSNAYRDDRIRRWLNNQFVRLDECNVPQLGHILFIFLAHVKALDGAQSKWCMGVGRELGAHIMKLSYVDSQ